MWEKLPSPRFLVLCEHNFPLGISIYLRAPPNLHDAADGPDVHFKAVPFLAQHFGGNVVWRPTQGLLPLPVILHPGGQAEVTWTDTRGNLLSPAWQGIQTQQVEPSKYLSQVPELQTRGGSRSHRPAWLSQLGRSPFPRLNGLPDLDTNSYKFGKALEF